MIDRDQLIREHVGSIKQIAYLNMKMDVRIMDIKNAYGNTRFLVAPVSGTGETWINALTIGINTDETLTP